MKTYIALDLETTGFDPLEDQVIEIAAVKFTGGKIIDRFETLVNPQIPIPPMITHITGIKAEDLTDAPLFPQIAEKLVNFIGNLPIIGHNIPFDISFLNRKGLQIPGPLYDTLQLSSILLPGLASYSLDTLTRILKINHEKKHRAMSDTMACYELFLILEQKIHQIDKETHLEIMKILGKSTWELRDLFAEVLPDQTVRSKKMLIGKKKKEPQASVIFNEKDLADFYNTDGPLAKTIKDYEPRAMQKQMTDLILDSFANSKNLLVEAGTGTGKTLAYLLASIYWSINSGKKVVVSTHTRNLQEQIIAKDLPLLAKVLQKLDPPLYFKSANLKGRRNYLSYMRFRNFLQKDIFLDHEVTLLIKIILWLKETGSGDLDDLSLQGREFAVLDEICCAEYVCRHEDPDYVDGCYLMKARSAAESANIIVVNHALLMQDALAESPLLPENRYLIIDEAHHLERVATESLTISISYHNYIRPFEKVLRIFDDLLKTPAGIFSDFQASDRLKTLKNAIHHLVSRIDIFFGLLGIFMEKNLEPSQFQYHLNLKHFHLGSPDWNKVIKSAAGVTENGLDFMKNLKAFHEELRLPGASAKEIKNVIYECEKRLKDIGKAVPEPAPDQNGSERISWLFKSPEGGVSLKSAPASIGMTLQEILFNKKDSIILTSATLRTDHSFNFIRDQLNLDESFKESFLPSHFDFPEQVKILIPEDLPEPASEGYFIGCAGLIANIIRKNRGRTLVLFTSKKALSGTYHEIAPQLKEEGFTVLAQNITGGRGKILEHFKDEPDKCAIFGTTSFWEGVDIKGDDLTCVVMQKLPFDPPEDPIILARSSKYHDSFNQFQLPRAILKFKQGFGRLIRSSSDTGAIVILDSRIIHKSYGRQFLESLPEGIKVEIGSARQLPGLL